MNGFYSFNRGWVGVQSTSHFFLEAGATSSAEVVPHLCLKVKEETRFGKFSVFSKSVFILSVILQNVLDLRVF